MATTKSKRNKRRAKPLVFPLPPSDFLYLQADEPTLKQFGLVPLRALHPTIASTLERAMATPTTFIRPVIRTNRRVGRGPGKTIRITAGAEVNSKWSGIVVPAANGNAITSVTGQWTVPNVAASTPGPSNCAFWVGIDGYGSPDVLQAGIQCDVNNGGVRIYPWWEWFTYNQPNSNQQPISNLQVSVGDEIYCLIAGQVAGPTATILLKNMTTGFAVNVSHPANAPRGTTLTGSSAEWIVESPEVNDNPVTLSNFGGLRFNSCIAEDSGGNPLDPARGTALSLEQNGQVVSTGASPASGQVLCTYSGPVIG